MATVIPRNSVIEANQSGLIAEPLVDITPQLPLPSYRSAMVLGAVMAWLTGCMHCWWWPLFWALW